MRVPEQCLERLRVAGLLVSEPFVPNHAAYPDGAVVGKPTGVGGNALKDRPLFTWGIDGVSLDAPLLYLHFDGHSWVVSSRDYVPMPGPGDFVNQWGTAEEAVEDILAFYFGDPSRMLAKDADDGRRGARS